MPVDERLSPPVHRQRPIGGELDGPRIPHAIGVGEEDGLRGVDETAVQEGLGVRVMGKG